MKEIHQRARPARTIYKCEYCGRVNIKKETMEKHEKICFYNPNRKVGDCPVCLGEGYLNEYVEYEPGVIHVPCPACETWKNIHGKNRRE